MSLIYDVADLTGDYDSKQAIRKTRQKGCIILILNFVLLGIDIAALVLEIINQKQRRYLTCIPIGVSSFAIFFNLFELSAINFFLTTKFNCLVAFSIINAILEIGVHVAFALPMTSNISEQRKLFMWVGVGVAGIISILTLWKACYMCKYMSNRRYSSQVDYSLLTEAQKRELLRSSLYPDQ